MWGQGEGDVCWIYGTKKRWTMDYIALEDKRNYWTCDHYCESLVEQLAYHFKIITTRLLWKPSLTISARCDLPWEPIKLIDPIWPPRSTEAVSYPVLWLSSPGQCSGLSSVGWAGQTLRGMTGLGSFSCICERRCRHTEWSLMFAGFPCSRINRLGWERSPSASTPRRIKRCRKRPWEMSSKSLNRHDRVF